MKLTSPPNFIKLVSGAPPQVKNLFSQLNVGDCVTDIWYGGEGIVLSKIKTKAVIGFCAPSETIDGVHSWDRAHINKFLRLYKSERR